MPFRSSRQERFLWKFHPEIARRWAREYGSFRKRRRRGRLVKKK